MVLGHLSVDTMKGKSQTYKMLSPNALKPKRTIEGYKSPAVLKDPPSKKGTIKYPKQVGNNARDLSSNKVYAEYFMPAQRDESSKPNSRGVSTDRTQMLAHAKNYKEMCLMTASRSFKPKKQPSGIFSPGKVPESSAEANPYCYIAKKEVKNRSGSSKGRSTGDSG